MSEAKEEEFPILCETCLGENPYVRMTKERFGKACKICDRPFTVYRWRPGSEGRYKKTEICITCAKLKNVCQTCVLDLQFGLPVQVRDSVLEESERMKIPVSDVNRDYMIERMEKSLDPTDANPVVSAQGGAMVRPDAVLSRLRRKAPYYQRNLPHICSFFVSGTCNRGDSCPYRHEMPVTGELANQNIKDRYYGQNDPVAKKMLNRGKEPAAPMAPPADQTITTLWLGGVDEKMAESEVRDKMFQYGEITSVKLVPAKGCGFVTFVRRSSAEEAASKLFNNLTVNGVRLKVAWGKKVVNSHVAPPPGVNGAIPLVHNPDANKYLAIPKPEEPAVALAPPPGIKGAPQPYYPSMDPKNLGAKLS